MNYLDRHRDMSSRDLDHLREHCKREVGGGYEFRLHGRNAGLDAHFASVPLVELALLHVTYGKTDIEVDISEIQEDAVLFCQLTDGDAVVRRNGRAESLWHMGPEDIFIRDVRAPVTLRQRDFGCLAMPVPKDRLRRHAEALFGPLEKCPDLDFEIAVAQSQQPANKMLGASLRFVAAQLNDAPPGAAGPLVLAAWEDLLLTQMLGVIPGDLQNLAQGRLASGAQPYHVKRARDFIHSQAHQRIQLSELASVAGCSLRTLQGAFADATGLSPMAYLKRVRLERAHAELEATSPVGASVAEIARRWGFAHSGRFAVEYARFYGRSPSTTLNRGR